MAMYKVQILSLLVACCVPFEQNNENDVIAVCARCPSSSSFYCFYIK